MESSDDLGYYLKKTHTYVCEDCDYRWHLRVDFEEEISLDYEDSFNSGGVVSCPMCGSENISEL